MPVSSEQDAVIIGARQLDIGAFSRNRSLSSSSSMSAPG